MTRADPCGGAGMTRADREELAREKDDGIPEDVSARCEAEECTRAGEVLGKRGLLCIECARESERAS